MPSNSEIASSRDQTIALDYLVARPDLGHTRLDLFEIGGREGLAAGEVVIEAVLDGGADGHLDVGVELLDRLRQEVRGVVAQDLERVLIACSDHTHGRVVFDRSGEIAQLAIDFDQKRRLGESGADGGREGGAGHGGVERERRTVRQRECRHGGGVKSLVPPRSRHSSRGASPVKTSGTPATVA